MSKLRNGSKVDSNPSSLDRESDIPPMSYRAPLEKCNRPCSTAVHTQVNEFLLTLDRVLKRITTFQASQLEVLVT